MPSELGRLLLERVADQHSEARNQVRDCQSVVFGIGSRGPTLAVFDAGCDNADILNHCRQPGVHVRGCWILDLILSKDR